MSIPTRCLRPTVGVMVLVAARDTVADSPSQMTIRLGESIKKIEGQRWPRYSDGTTSTLMLIDKTVEVRIVVGEREYACATSTLFARHEGDVVRSVSITPVPREVAFLDAIEQVHTLKRSLRIEAAAKLRETLIVWSKLPDEDRKPILATRVLIGDSGSLRCEIAPGKSDGKWNVYFDFTALARTANESK